MRVKITGIGKCGVRIAYDLFAYTNEFPSAYEIRLRDDEGGIYEKFMKKAGINTTYIDEHITAFRAQIKSVINDLSGEYRIKENPVYAIIDSDVDNNEIISRNVLLEKDDKKAMFPGKHHLLNNHKGGCNVHIVSESLALNWQDIPEEIIDCEPVSIYVTSFSIAGGTGGGSAPIISRYSTEKLKELNDANRCHHMGLGVLPKSDEKYIENEQGLNMADYEKFNAGRFLASIYAGRFDKDMKSLWLFSNDAMRFLLKEKYFEEALVGAKGEQNLNLSLVNTFIAQSLSVLSNSSSPSTIADTNLDPRELNDILAGRPFMSALSHRQVEAGDQSLEHQVLSVKQLLLNALSNVYNRNGQLEGLSVPVREAKLQGLHTILKDRTSKRDRFLKSVDDHDIEDLPFEFRTTWKLVILYGQPVNFYSQEKIEMIMGACEKFFPKAQKCQFTFQQKGTTETLLLFLVDPFILPVVASIYYYANSAWGQVGKNLSEDLDTLIRTKKFGKLSFLDDSEGFPLSAYGGGVDDIKRRVEERPELAIDRKEIEAAFHHLHNIYHRERPPMNTSSGLG